MVCTLLVPTRLLHLELRDSQLGHSKIVFEINVSGAGNHIDDRPFFETVAVFLFSMCNLGMWEGRTVLLDELFYGVDITFPCLAYRPVFGRGILENIAVCGFGNGFCLAVKFGENFKFTVTKIFMICCNAFLVPYNEQ